MNAEPTTPKKARGQRVWTDAQRAAQARKIREYQIWRNSTGPRTAHGKSISCLNALKHGATSRPAKAFMAHFRQYYATLKLCFAKKRTFLQIQKNELINARHVLAQKNRKSFAQSPRRP